MFGEDFQRPIDVPYGPNDSFYVLDFGYYEMVSPIEMDMTPGSGNLDHIGEPKFVALTLLPDEEHQKRCSSGCVKLPAVSNTTLMRPSKHSVVGHR